MLSNARCKLLWVWRMRQVLSFVIVLLIGFLLGVAFHRAGLLHTTVAMVLPKRVLTKPPPDFSDSTFYQIKAPLEAAFPTKADVVMVGDSLTEMPDWRALFPNVRIANYGISGDSTDGALRRLDAILATGARTAFVMLGINDIYRGIPADITIANFRRLIHALRTSGMSVYVESILFTRQPDEAASIAALNKSLSETCTSGPTCVFIDLNSRLATGDLLRSDFSFDGIHLTPPAYAAWRDAIRPFLPTTDPRPGSPVERQ
jgi:lysophospholipase L1-like esterase